MTRTINQSHHIILSTKNNTLLFEGMFKSFQDCLESAIHENIDLSHANLRHKNLQNANCDDGVLNHADFTGSNLSGANFSEAQLSGAIFNHTDLYNSCLAYADLSHAIFKDANFGATDITHTNLTHAIFSGLSSFTLNFRLARDIRGCTYEAPDGTSCPFSQPPLTISGQQKPCIILDQHIIMDSRVLGTKQTQTAQRLKMEINSSIIELCLTYKEPIAIPA